MKILFFPLFWRRVVWRRQNGIGLNRNTCAVLYTQRQTSLFLHHVLCMYNAQPIAASLSTTSTPICQLIQLSPLSLLLSFRGIYTWHNGAAIRAYNPCTYTRSGHTYYTYNLIDSNTHAVTRSHTQAQLSARIRYIITKHKVQRRIYLCVRFLHMTTTCLHAYHTWRASAQHKTGAHFVTLRFPFVV